MNPHKATGEENLTIGGGLTQWKGTPSRRKLLTGISTAMSVASLSPTTKAASSGGQQLEGAWLTTIGTPGFAPSSGLILFTRDGMVVETNVIEVPAIPPLAGAFFTDGFGEWIRTGDREFSLVFLKLLARAGTAAGVFKLRARLTLKSTLIELSGSNSFEFLNANAQIVLQGAGTVSATRIGVDELPTG